MGGCEEGACSRLSFSVSFSCLHSFRAMLVGEG